MARKKAGQARGHNPASAGPGKRARPGAPEGAAGAAGPGRGRAGRAPEVAPDLRVQLPYFLIRLAVLVILSVVLIAVGVAPLLGILIGFAVAGLLTWPLGRMQRRAAQRSAAQRSAERRSAERRSAGQARADGSPRNPPAS
ncbi:hypothetical protein MXD62_00620 [Frankia sp. Mgl5]|uniref:hypothetical protein n=1 Tax=Frankia sp. Mgl5 TaxID=2933793 RepID=UPI00200C1649|nr:hypothetical protein [Frankia sp. Mgl5]MCK9925683.1 hypothetical protein [Frankia sp. Mgl5]